MLLLAILLNVPSAQQELMAPPMECTNALLVPLVNSPAPPAKLPATLAPQIHILRLDPRPARRAPIVAQVLPGQHTC